MQKFELKSLKLCVGGNFENQAKNELPLKSFIWEGGLPCLCAFGWKLCTVFDNVGICCSAHLVLLKDVINSIFFDLKCSTSATWSW